MFETFAFPNDQIHVNFPTTQPSCLLITSYVHAYGRDHSSRSPHLLTHSAAMPTTPTAQKGMIVPKESVYVRFVDWGCGPCTKYVVFYTYRDETNTHGVGLQIHIVFVWVSFIRHPVWGNLKTVFVRPLVYDRWRNSYLINISSSNNSSYYYSHTASTLLVNSRTFVCMYM